LDSLIPVPLAGSVPSIPSRTDVMAYAMADAALGRTANSG
jgi:hypothetical protein